MEFEDKVVIITGSTSGIGERTALEFAKSGAKVVIHGRDENRLNAVVNKCLELSPTKRNAIGVLADVRDDEKLKKMVEKTIDTFGKIDVLVNNAGIAIHESVESPNIVAAFDEVLNSNLRPTVVLSSLVIPHLIASKGCIVNISSILSVKPLPYFMPTAARDAAKDMITRCMALELGPKGVRVNSVQAGYIKTPVFEKLGFKFEEMEDLKKQPLAKHGDPMDAAHCVLFLASPKSAFITGTTLLADGGLTQA